MIDSSPTYPGELFLKSLAAPKVTPSGGPTKFAIVTRDGSDTPEGVVVPFRGCDTPRETFTCSSSVFGHRFVFGIFMGDLPDSPGFPPMIHDNLAFYVEDFGTRSLLFSLALDLP